jgi:hypothetical protein
MLIYSVENTNNIFSQKKTLSTFWDDIDTAVFVKYGVVRKHAL